MKQFINAKETLVTESIDGLLRTCGDQLVRLDGFPHIKVVLRKDWNKDKVALISGGGSGHEPSHVGFVGKGMLTAAVCGEVFASPSVDAVLAGILAVTGEKGCLLIVKNYTGDRLNFGLAMERARAKGLNVEMVIVNDDIAIPDLPQPRGVAGTLFVHKLAGAMAELDSDLKSIASSAQKVIDATVSIGISLDTCTIPGSMKESRVGLGMAELGLGIHGEAGVEQIEYVNAKTAMDAVVKKLKDKIGSVPHVALLNNLGGATPLEMSVLTEELAKSEIGSQIEWLIGPAPLMTSLDMHGFSLSLIPASQIEIELLKLAVAPSAWPGCNSFGGPNVVAIPDGLSFEKFQPSINEQTKQLIESCCRELIAAESNLNELDTKSGDGDTGSTLSTAAKSLIDKLDSFPLADNAFLCLAIGQELSQSMGGSSGVLLAIFFTATGESLKSGQSLVDALKSGLKRVQQVGGATLGDRSMIDALAPALDSLDSGLEKAANSARKGADSTANITRAKAGRASYLPESALAGYNDPGAEAIALVFEHLIRET